VIEHNVPSRVYITDEEYTLLLNVAVITERDLHVCFGDNRTWLSESEINAWAFTQLVEWRGLPT